MHENEKKRRKIMGRIAKAVGLLTILMVLTVGCSTTKVTPPKNTTIISGEPQTIEAVKPPEKKLFPNGSLYWIPVVGDILFVSDIVANVVTAVDEAKSENPDKK